MSTFAFVQDGETRRTSRSFFRGETTNFHPTNASIRRTDAIDTYVIKGWAPEERFVTSDTPIVAFGSCFAANISNYLSNRNYNVLNKRESRAYVTNLGDGMVNTYAILQQFEWAWTGKAPQADVWHGKKAEGYEHDESVRLETRAMFDEAELFIITLGLSELWYDEPTGEVFWRAVPADAFDAARHKFRTATHRETLENLEKIYGLIRQFRPDAKILFTVSPIPLTATFRDVSCLTADAVSKATLRSALDEFLKTRGQREGVFYFPSYEAVTRVFRNQWCDDRRHVQNDVLAFNMKMFEHYYCAPGISKEALIEAYDYAQDLDLRRGELMRDRPQVSYEDARQARIKGKIEARKEARRLESSQRREARRNGLVVSGDDRHQALIQARVEARKNARSLERAKLQAERIQKRTFAHRLKMQRVSAKQTITGSRPSSRTRIYLWRGAKGVIALLAIDSLIDWTSFAFLALP